MGRDKVMHAAATLLAVAVASGCGGDDENKSTATIKSVPTTQQKAPTDKDARSSRTKKPTVRKQPAAEPSFENQTPLQRALREAGRKAPPSKRVGIVRTVTRMVLSRFGFSPTVTVASSGTAVRAALSRQEACTATSRTEGRLVSALRDGLPWLDSARIVVDRTGQPLSQYVRAHCRPVTLPKGNGPVRLLKSGTYLAKTGSFTIHSDRWTVEYINGGSYLQVVVLKSGVPSSAGVQVTKRGPGRRVFRGAGKVALQIAGSGEWIVRVRDGA
jgi:hypothetical protein